jgi:trans-aconitate 2-methyltransferase
MMTEWNAVGYSRIATLQEAMATEVLALLKVRGDERVLDLGCGNGKVTAQIAARVPEGSVVGVDASTEMIAFATEHFHPPKLCFETCDIRQLVYREEFDLVVSFNALHWISNQEIALRAIRSAMKPDAIAQLRLVPDGERKSLEMVLEETRKSSRWGRYYEGFRDPYLHLTPDEYAALAERNGLHVSNLQVGDKSWDFGSRAGFEAFGAVTFVEWSKRVPESERPAFVEDVLQHYAEVVGDDHTFRFYQMDVELGVSRDQAK